MVECKNAHILYSPHIKKAEYFFIPWIWADFVTCFGSQNEAEATETGPQEALHISSSSLGALPPSHEQSLANLLEDKKWQDLREDVTAEPP